VIEHRQFFDFRVETNAYLPELALAGSLWFRERTLEIRFERAPPRAEVPFDSSLTPWSASHRSVSQGWIGDAMLIRCHGVADYWVKPAERFVRCCSAVDADPGAVRHFLLNQVLPRLVSYHAPLVIHAAGIVTKDGAVAFAGPSGIGKSTLVASFAQSQEAIVIADDSVLLRVEHDDARAIGGYTCCRLRLDSVAELELTANTRQSERHSASKRIFTPPDATDPLPIPVAGVFVLDESEPSPRGAASVTRLRGAQAVLAIVRNAFLLDNRHPELIRNQFKEAGQLVQTDCAVYSLKYPRRYDRLPEVRALILSVLRTDVRGADSGDAGI
jgi:hypothetical protein